MGVPLADKILKLFLGGDTWAVDRRREASTRLIGNPVSIKACDVALSLFTFTVNHGHVDLVSLAFSVDTGRFIPGSAPVNRFSRFSTVR